MPSDHLRFERRDALAVLTLANPDGNRFNRAILDGLTEALAEISAGGYGALLLQGDGPLFSLGADVKELLTLPETELLATVERYLGLLGTIARLPIPSIAAVHGVCSSGGLEMALACDLLWAAEGTQLGFLETLIAIPPLVGGVQRIAARAGRARAFEIAAAGRHFDAREFHGWNIVNRILPAEQLRAEALAYATTLAGGPSIAYAGIKAMLEAWDSDGVPGADQVTVAAVAPALASDLFKTRVAGFLARSARA